MRHYETIYIANPDFSEEAYKDLISKCNGIIEKNKGVPIKVEEWGKNRLAYLVKKFDRGSYVLLNFCGESGLTRELEREMKLDERVLKFQTVKLADSADPQALILKEKDALKEGEAGAVPDNKPADTETEEEGAPAHEGEAPEGEVKHGNK